MKDPRAPRPSLTPPASDVGSGVGLNDHSSDHQGLLTVRVGVLPLALVEAVPAPICFPSYPRLWLPDPPRRTDVGVGTTPSRLTGRGGEGRPSRRSTRLVHVSSAPNASRGWRPRVVKVGFQGKTRKVDISLFCLLSTDQVSPSPLVCSTSFNGTLSCQFETTRE